MFHAPLVASFIRGLGSEAPAKAPRNKVVATMDKAFNETFGRPFWTQMDVAAGRCDQEDRNQDVQTWNSALVRARDADYLVENLT